MQGISLTTLLIVVLFALQIGGLIYVLRLKQQQKLLTNTLAEVVREQQALLSGSLGLGRRLTRFGHHLNALEQTRDEVIDDASMEDKTFEEATLMLQKGATVNDVVERCQLSLGEAELLSDMLARTAVVH
ncbi:DUF2802 domain-containing protein [Pleionea sp. CnH1-48]|uniref:DUF2802 domain-containing protein n=1 Tax=Pleionea sp. CnH1-48 TaxID=2954494 RepID=UPI002096F18F|nr:DUF2802 domain-containing protein [Pleionea sp. CnH1-48]MCO7226083.1 DUF2802 domain-containing protein [Pleionea sp. CnH1-48]